MHKLSSIIRAVEARLKITEGSQTVELLMFALFEERRTTDKLNK